MQLKPTVDCVEAVLSVRWSNLDVYGRWVWVEFSVNMNTMSGHGFLVLPSWPHSFFYIHWATKKQKGRRKAFKLYLLLFSLVKHIELVFSNDIICFQVLVQQQELLVPCHLLCALEMGTLLFQLEAELWSAQSPLLLTTTVLWLVHIYCQALFLSIAFPFFPICLVGFGFVFFFLLSNGKCPQLLHLWWRDCVFFSPWRAASSSEPPLGWAFCGNTTANYLHIACFVGVSLELCNSCATLNPNNRPCEPHS